MNFTKIATDLYNTSGSTNALLRQLISYQNHDNNTKDDNNTEDDNGIKTAADCGCVYECVVYEEEDQFECLCPNNTQLAPDLSDCYYSELIST